MHDLKNIEEAVSELLDSFEFGSGRAWKWFDFDVVQSLANQGLLSDPMGKSESVRLTPEGMASAKALADWFFGA